MKKEILRSNRAVTMTDLVTGMLILIIFTGILTSSFSQIYKNNIYIKLNGIATNYAIAILENIDKMPYEEVTEDINSTIREDYNINKNFNANVSVENYNSDKPEKEDIIKIVTVTINYNFNNTEDRYTVRKLKIKEM